MVVAHRPRWDPLSATPHASLERMLGLTMTLNLSPNLQMPAADSGSRASAPRASRGEVPLTLTLRHGGEATVALRYELAGREGAPLLIVAGGISAGRHTVSSAEFAEEGWWQAQAATLDRCAYRILSIDWLGADGAARPCRSIPPTRPTPSCISWT